ncbi:DUF4097 domain-containing protein [Pseudalkalibacillus sp. SCS-8]|uniref:DUF4097 family beta strand repeat-containing protein n=1 Tax=Pseudalkalibacillus nanhaiensis TaxID=3115291 RepID=UPI0032DA35E8
MEERKMILKMLDEGRITTSEAVELLKAIGENTDSLKVNNSSETQEEPDSQQASHTSHAQSKTEENAKQANQEQNTTGKKSESTISRFSSLIDRVVTKLKDSDFDFNFGQSIEVDHVFQENDVDINRVKVHITNGGIKLHPWEEQSVRVECRASVFRTQTVEDAKSYFMKNVHFALESGELQMMVDENRMKVQAHMYIPTKLYEEVQLRTSNGAISLNDIQTEAMTVRTSNGAVSLDRVEGKTLHVSTSNGKIKLENSDWKKVELETLNGAIRMNGRYERAEAETLNGSIMFVLDEAIPGNASFKTVAGKIELLVPETLRIDGNLKATIGSLNCYLDKVKMNKESKDVVQKEMEFISNEEAATTFKIEAEAKTGSISIAKR